MKNGCSLNLNRFLTDSYLSKSRQLLDRYYLSRSRQLLDRYYLSRITKSEFSDMIFSPCWHVCVGFFFLTILDIYKAYFKGRHIREYNENTCKRWSIPYSLWRKLLRLWTLGFCNLVLLDLYCWWSKELYSQQSSSSWRVSYILGTVHYWLVTY